MGKKLLLAFTASSLLLLFMRRVYNSSLLFDQIFFLTFFVSVLVCYGYSIVTQKNFSLYNPFRNKTLLLDVLLIWTFSVFWIAAPLLNVDRSRSILVLICVDEGVIGKIENGKFYEIKVPNAKMELPKELELRLEEMEERKIVVTEGGEVSLSELGDIVVLGATTLSKVYNLALFKAEYARIKKEKTC